MPQRIFFAVEIAEQTRRALARVAEGLDTGGAKIRFVAPRNLHVTMNFLGDVGDALLRQVCDAAAEVAGGVEPFEFSVSGLRSVPPGGRLRMIWANVCDPAGRLTDLQERLAASLETLGFPRESRSYRPHLTLARVKFAREDRVLRAGIERFGEEPFGTQQATQVTVFSSELTPAGPIYTPAKRAPLGG